MKITEIEAIPVRLPVRYPVPPAGFGSRDWTGVDVLIVRVATAEGITGYGEAFGYDAVPATRAALETLVTPLAVGEDATDIAGLLGRLQRKLQYYGRYGITIFALSGLDIALWDIAGKVAGLPLHRLLGGAPRRSLDAYACLPRYGDAGALRELIARDVAEGYRYVKIHEDTLPEIAAAREAAGDGVGLMVDVNSAWEPRVAIERLAAMEPYGLHWIEEPVWPPEDYPGLASVRRRAAIPITSGENACTSWDFRAMFAAGAVDYAQPSITKVGGVTEFRRVATLAGHAEVPLAPHSPFFGPGFIATLQVMAALVPEAPVEHLRRIFDHPLYATALDAHDGRLAVPQGPGLGIDPDLEVVERFRTDR